MKKLIATLAVTAIVAGFAANANAARTITLSNTIVSGSSSNRVTYTGPVTPVVIAPRVVTSRRGIVKSKGFTRTYTPIRHRYTFIPTAP